MRSFRLSQRTAKMIVINPNISPIWINRFRSNHEEYSQPICLYSLSMERRELRLTKHQNRHSELTEKCSNTNTGGFQENYNLELPMVVYHLYHKYEIRKKNRQV